MPTGYTAFIEDGRVNTGQEFLTLCVRAFGAAIEARDEPLSPEMVRLGTVPSYYKKAFFEAQDKLNTLSRRTDEAWKTALDEDRLNAFQLWQKAEAERRVLLARYDAIRSQVEDWIPPTEEHEGLKEFALNQIDESIEYVSDGWYYKQAYDDLATMSVEAYKEAALLKAKNNFSYASDSLAKEKERVNERNLWLSRFITSFGLPKEIESDD